MKPPVPWFLLFLAAVSLRAATMDVLIAVASQEELQPFVNRLGNPRTEQRAAWQFWSGTLGDKQVVLTRTEGDPLNAVAATTLAIRRYSPRLVVTAGLARAHDPELRPGDVVVSRAFAAFDGLISEPRALGAGVAPLTWQRLPHALMTPGEKEQYQAEFPADPAALAAAGRLRPGRGRLVIGILGSAPQVNREADRIAWIRKTWNTSCEDQESAHVAGAARLLDTPVIGLRVIDGTPEETAATVIQFVEAWK